jgi:YgiT-type zinc finger domain-containing protein
MNCVMCKGKLIDGKVNHIVDINGHIIIIKNVPANICTQCGEYYIDNKTALILEELIDKVLISNTEVMIINYPSAA